MSAIALHLPDALIEESMLLAKKLKISRSEFIRLALKDEIDKVKRQFAEAEMLKAFQAMAKSSEYLTQTKALDSLDSSLPVEIAGEGIWWKKP
jgi:metal-responsive CopG/Arc/MetJ family transcriptional regulator